MGKMKLRDENGRIYFGYFIIIMSLFMMMFGYCSVVTISGVFVVPVTNDLGIQIGDFVIWTTIMSGTAMIYLMIMSKFYNKNTIRPIMLICAILGAIGFIGFSRATEVWHFYLFAVPMGVCFGGLTATPSSVLVNNWFGSKCKGVALALVFSGAAIASAVLIPLSNYLVINYGWRTTYMLIAGALLVICVPLVLFCAVWSPEQKGIKKMGEGIEEAGYEKSGSKQVPGISFKDGLKRPSTWFMFFSGTLVATGSSAILTHTQPFLITLGFSPTFSANIMSANVVALCIGGIIVGAICDRYKLQISALGSCMMFAIAYASQLVIPYAAWAVVILVIGYGLGGTAINIIPNVIAHYMFGDKEITGYIGYINVFISLGGAFGATLVGKLFDITGNYMVPFIVCTMLMLVSGLIRGVVTMDKYKFVPEKIQRAAGQQ